MFYKVIGNGTVLDVLKSPKYITFQERNNLIVLCNRSGARGVISTDGSTVWHVLGWERIPIPNIASVQLVEIGEEEYEMLKNNMGADTPGAEDETQIELEPSEITLEYLKEKKIAKMKTICEETIISGVDVVFSDGLKHHFDLTIEDQINLISLKEMITAGAKEIPYHESGCLCKMYSPEDITVLLDAASNHKTYQVTYFNSLKGYINSLKEIDAVNNVYYGMIIPEDHRSEVLIAITGGI